MLVRRKWLRGAFSYSRVTERALGDGLEQSGLADVGEADNATLQAVPGPAQRNLLLDNSLLGRHLAFWSR
jgi:hypothetical protein